MRLRRVAAMTFSWSLFAESTLDGIIIGLIYGVASLGLSLAFGVMGVINVAYGDFLILGSFLIFTLYAIGIDPLLGLLVLVGAGILTGYLLQKWLVNKVIGGHLATLMLFFGFAIALPNIYIMVWGPYTKSIIVPYLTETIKIGAVSLTLSRLVAGIIAAIAIVATLYAYHKTKLGLAMRATAQNREAAELFGINVSSIYAWALAISLALAMLSGGLIAFLLAFSPVQGPIYTLLAFLIVVLGGMGYPLGSIIAGVIMGLIQSWSSTFLGPSYTYAIMFLLLYLILLISPKGLLRRGI